MASEAVTKSNAAIFNDLTRTPQGPRRLVSTIVTREEFAVRMRMDLDDPDYSILIPIRKWLENFMDLPTGKGALCACCPNEVAFNKSASSWPKKFVVMYPDGAQARDIGPVVATCSPVCEECSKLDDAQVADGMSQYLGDKPGDWKRA